VQYHFDTKAKRKIPEGSAMVLVIENSSGGIIISMVTRSLTMLSGT